MKRNRGGVAIALSLAKVLILSLPGVTALFLLRPEGGLHGTYSTPNPAGTEVVITSRLDPSIDFPTPHLLQNPFFEHWNFRALGVPATFPPFEVRWTGYLNASEGGLYRFQVDTAGEVRFLLDGRPLTPEPGKETGGVSVILASGWHAVELVYRRGAENPGIRLFWQRPSAALP